MLQSLEEQGKPSLSQLVGKGRQVKLEPPCELLENGVLEHMAPANSSVPTNSCPLSIKVPLDDPPPGLPEPKSVVTLTCAGIACVVEDLVEGPSYSVERVKDPKIHMKDRVVKMENIPLISELDVLVSIFPYEEVNNLTHYYQMLGFDGCVKLFVELGTYVDWSASVTEGAFVEELAAAEMSATCPHAPPPRTDWQRIAEQEGMNGRWLISIFNHYSLNFIFYTLLF
ncbi:unnamed protein product [Strongylus vulgaris]|uniref:Uncharacterized protein n=1 Tax=Strongylus vulgaris TaxID=40348 RepID=A0A3P7JBM1_STRVU|nr:unnamed protein product [Strongylus vulgaris]